MINQSTSKLRVILCPADPIYKRLENKIFHLGHFRIQCEPQKNIGVDTMYSRAE